MIDFSPFGSGIVAGLVLSLLIGLAAEHFGAGRPPDPDGPKGPGT